MIEALTAAARPGLPWIRDPGPAEGERVVALADLLSPAALQAALGAARAAAPADACPLAVASVWSKRFLAGLLAGPMVQALAGAPPAAKEAVLSAEGAPVALVAILPEDFTGAPAAEGLADWLCGPVAGMLDRLSGLSGLASRTYWSNAATLISFLFEHWSRQPAVAGRAALLRAAIMEQPALGRLSPNPLLRQIAYVPSGAPGYENGTRRRRLCCLRDRIGYRLCASCPKIDPAARDALLTAHA